MRRALREAGGLVVLWQGGTGGGELLRLAAAQRMSTEARRAVFCVVLDSQDCADALERLLRLPLKARPRPCCAGREASRCQE